MRPRQNFYSKVRQRLSIVTPKRHDQGFSASFHTLGPLTRHEALYPSVKTGHKHLVHAIVHANSDNIGVEYGLGCFTIIIDDIVQPDGRTHMGCLGGGGPQTLYGYQTMTSQRNTVALAAGVGSDFPQDCWDWIEKIGCSAKEIRVLPDRRTPRAWQLMEADGRRTQVWRTPAEPALYAMLRPDMQSLSPTFLRAAALHLGINPNSPDLPLMQHLFDAANAQGGLFALEPWCPSVKVPDTAALRSLVSPCHVFSPNELEAASLTGLHSERDMLLKLLGAGAAMVALRCGAKGSVVAQAASETCWRVPAVQGVNEVDTVGCGNAYLGGFIAALQDRKTAGEAAAWGAVAASFMLEALGVPQVAPAELRTAMEVRLQRLLPLVQQYQL